MISLCTNCPLEEQERTLQVAKRTEANTNTNIKECAQIQHLFGQIELGQQLSQELMGGLDKRIAGCVTLTEECVGSGDRWLGRADGREDCQDKVGGT